VTPTTAPEASSEEENKDSSDATVDDKTPGDLLAEFSDEESVPSSQGKTPKELFQYVLNELQQKISATAPEAAAITVTLDASSDEFSEGETESSSDEETVRKAAETILNELVAICEREIPETPTINTLNESSDEETVTSAITDPLDESSDEEPEVQEYNEDEPNVMLSGTNKPLFFSPSKITNECNLRLYQLDAYQKMFMENFRDAADAQIEGTQNLAENGARTSLTNS